MSYFFLKKFNSFSFSLFFNLQFSAGNRTFIIYSFIYALAQSLPICSYAATFSYGAYLMSLEEINLTGIFKYGFILIYL